MKRTAFILLFGLAVPSLALAEQKTNDPLSDAMQLLRKAMRDFEKNPNAASEARSNIAASAKAAAATAKTEAAADAARAPLSPQAAPALAASAAAPSASVPDRSFAEMEQMYLDGRITAKEFQKYLQNIRLKPLKTEPAPPATTNVAAAAPVTNAPVLPTVGTAPDAMTDVEKKLDELIRAQEAREKAATNQAPATTGPKTKRQRLDDLLKQLVEGKISDEDYKSQRAKIMAEPD